MSVEMIGQKNIQDKIKDLTLNSLPHTLILIGEKGCGKHLTCEKLSEHLNIPLVDITEVISYEYISEISLSTSPSIYLIDGASITEKKESALLKFLEEPAKTAYIVILYESSNQILSTIKNRGQSWVFEPYKSSELESFKNPTQDNRAYVLARTPGQMIKLQNQDLNLIDNLCNTIIQKIGGANYANVLTITDKLALNNESDKIDVDVFIKYLMLCIVSGLKADNNPKLEQAYRLTNDLYNSRYISHINERNLIDNYLTSLKELLS